MKFTWIRRVLVVAALGAGAAGAVPPTLSTAPTASADSTGLGAGGEYHALEPARILDTRTGLNDIDAPGKKVTGKIGSGTEYTVQVAGEGGVPADPAQVLAVVLNVTVAEPEAQGNLAIRPTGTPAGESSLVNFLPGRNVPNLSIVGVGPDGKVTIKLETATPSKADVVIDVFGWISTSSYTGADVGARLIATDPGRVADTRTGAGTQIGPKQNLTVKVRGAQVGGTTIPDDPSVTAVMVNLTAINRQPGSTSTNLAVTPTLVPAGTDAATSNTNVIGGLVKASMAIVPIGPDGNIYIHNFQGNIHVAVDVLGYFQQISSESTQGRIIPLASPFRAFDTRTAAFGKAPLPNGTAEDWSFQKFAQSVTMQSNGSTVTLDQESAMIGNLTGTELTRLYPTIPVTTFLEAYPGDVTTRPDTSNINVPEGENVPNMSLLKFGEKGGDPYIVQMYNHAGSLHYILDVYAIVLK